MIKFALLFFVSHMLYAQQDRELEHLILEAACMHKIVLIEKKLNYQRVASREKIAVIEKNYEQILRKKNLSLCFLILGAFPTAFVMSNYISTKANSTSSIVLSILQRGILFGTTAGYNVYQRLHEEKNMSKRIGIAAATTLSITACYGALCHTLKDRALLHKGCSFAPNMYIGLIFAIICHDWYDPDIKRCEANRDEEIACINMKVENISKKLADRIALLKILRNDTPDCN